MHRRFRLFALTIIVSIPALTSAARGATASFEDISVPTDSALQDAGPSGVFVSGGAQFANSYFPPDGFGDPAFNDGWAISNVNNVTFPTKSDYVAGGQVDYAAPYQFSSFNGTQQLAGGGAGGSSNYAIGYDDGVAADSMVTLPAGTAPVSLDAANTTYTALDVIYGDGFFPSGFVPGDSLTLEIFGTKADQSAAGEVDFVLANYPLTATAPQVVSQWTAVDLTSLAGATTLTFSIVGGAQSQYNRFGLVNPTYFAVDNLVVAQAPEPSSLVLGLIASLCAAAAFARRRMRRAPG